MQAFLIDWLVIGIVIFVVGVIARAVTGELTRPQSGWVLCFIACVLLWPISIIGFLFACFKLARGFWRKYCSV